MRDHRRWLAFVLAPLIPSALFLFVLRPPTARVATLMLIVSTLFSYLPCLLLGLPLMKFLERRQSLTTVALTVGAAPIGAGVFYIFGLVFSALLGSPRSILPGVRELVSGALLGGFVAASFGLIAGFPLRRSKKGLT